MDKLSLFIDTPLPNSGWKRRVRAADPHTRRKLWALRIGLAILLVALAAVFKIHRHPELR